MSEDDKGSGDKVDPGNRNLTTDSPLQQETVWLKQHLYANAEMLYHMTLATGVPVKVANTSQELLVSTDLLDKRYQTEETAVLKSVKKIWKQLSEIEKAQNNKAQVVRDVVAKLAEAVENYQTNMSHELVHGVTQLNMFRSILRDVESVIDQTRSNIKAKKCGLFKTHKEYCVEVIDRLSKLDLDLNSFFNVYSSLQGRGLKFDNIEHIVEEISKISFCSKNGNVDTFVEKKDVVSSLIKSLLDDVSADCNDDSDASLEGSCSVYSDNSDNELEVNGETEKMIKSEKSQKINQETKRLGIRSNRNNANNVDVRNRGEKIKIVKTDSSRPLFVQNTPGVPVKRNAQGAQSIANKKSDLFQFRGVSSPSRVPFLNQPGLLGPRPNTLPIQGASQSIPFRFSNFSSSRQQVPSVPTSGTIHNLGSLSVLSQPRYSSINFNFSSSQPRASPFDMGRTSVGQNPLLASMGMNSPLSQGNHLAGNIINNQMKQSKLLQIQQNQNKGAKGSDQLFAAKSGIFYPLQQNPRTPLFLQNSQTGPGGSHSLGGVSRDNIEQQLNDMAQKIQQMQLATSQNLHLQQLMRETERLKQMVAQKHHQQQDQFKHQFQLLINAFMQQQQQQQMQGPQSKMARSVQFYNSQKQQQRSIHNRQQQIKKQKQDSKAKQEPKRESLLIKTKETISPGHCDEIKLQNGDQISTLASDERKIINENSKVARIGTFSPHAHGDKHRAGISSVVVMEDAGCVVVADIINSCIKQYNVTVTSVSPTELSHHLVTRLELSRPYYMSKLNKDMIVVSREGKLLSLIRVSKNRLECLKDLKTQTQYYGLGYVSDNVIVCAAFADGKIDLLNVHDGVTQTVTLLTQCKGPELVAAVPSTGCILYLGRVVSETVHLLGISQKGSIDFSIDLESSPTDVWSVASISDRIICCSKEIGKVKLFNNDGTFVTDVSFPVGSVNQPFAMAFCDSGNMYIANDGAWDNEYEHYVTTEINVYTFS